MRTFQKFEKLHKLPKYGMKKHKCFELFWDCWKNNKYIYIYVFMIYLLDNIFIINSITFMIIYSNNDYNTKGK